MILSFILLQAIIFQFYGQTAKYLQEKGLSGLGVLYYSRYVIYPATTLLLFTWSQESFGYLLSHHHILYTFIGFVTLNSLFQYVYFVSRNMTRSLSFVGAVLNAIGLPLVVVASVFINHDIPSIYEVLGIALLIMAVFLKPSSSKKSVHVPQLNYSILIIIGISLVYLCLQSFKDPLYREFMMNMPDMWFAVALYLFCSSFIINTFFLFKKMSKVDMIKEGGAKMKLLAYGIPILLFLGSLPEAYSFANAPVYTIIAVGMVNFVITLFFDIYFRRVLWNFQTFLFSILVIGGVMLNILGSSLL